MNSFKKHWVRYSSLALLFILIIGLIFAARGGRKTETVAKVVRADVVQEVSLTGSVRSEESVDLGFVRGGKVAAVQVKVGDTVRPGQALVSLDTKEAYANYLQAEASLREAKANFESIKVGTRPESIAIDRVKVENAEQVYVDSKKLLLSSLLDAYTKAEDAVNNKGDQLFDNGKYAPKFKYPLSDSVLQNRLETNRFLIEERLAELAAKINSVTFESDLAAVVALSQNALSLVSSFVADLATAVNSLNTSYNITAAVISGWKSDISTARTNVNTGISSLTSADKTSRDAFASLRLARHELILDESGATPQDIAAGEAKVSQVEANFRNAEAQLADMTIRAPIAGTITVVKPFPGEIVSMNEIVVSMINTESYEIEADVPEVDVGSLKVGMKMTFTLDAFSDAKGTGTIIKIDPAEKIVSGVPTYTIRFSIDPTKVPIRSGMTANITIVTNKREKVLAIPVRGVESRDDGTYVEIKGENGTRTEKKIEIGLRGSDGTVEVVSGLSEGEEIYLDRTE